MCRQILFIGCGWFFNLHKQSACLGEQAASWSPGCARSPTFGSRTYLQLWIDGNKVANIGPGQRYDESIPAGHHVLAVNYTPRTQHQPTSMRLTVHPGETYGFNAIRDSIQGVSFRQSKRIPPLTERSPALEHRDRTNQQRALVLGCSLPSEFP